MATISLTRDIALKDIKPLEAQQKKASLSKKAIKEYTIEKASIQKLATAILKKEDRN